MNENHDQNQMIVADEGFIGQLTSRTTMFCSLSAETDEQRAALFNAMNNPDERISDHINGTILMKDLFCETVSLVNKQTGELQECPRIVIIDNEGVSYQAVSLGLFSALKKIIAIYGPPTWVNPIAIEVKQIKKAEKSLLTFNIAGAGKAKKAKA